MQRITDAAERAKIALSERTETRIHVPFVTMVESKPLDLDVMLTRDKLVELTHPLVDRIDRGLPARCSRPKKLTANDIDEMILVGGQSRAPLVQERITVFFGKPPAKSVHPDEAVAIGAALLAHSLEQKEGRGADRRAADVHRRRAAGRALQAGDRPQHRAAGEAHPRAPHHPRRPAASSS